jgi:hypothetical protein
VLANRITLAQRLSVAVVGAWLYAAEAHAWPSPVAPPSEATEPAPAAATPAPAAPQASSTEAPAPAEQPQPVPVEPALATAPSKPAPSQPKAAQAQPGPKPAPKSATAAMQPPPPQPDQRSWIGAGIGLGVLDLPKLAAGVQLRGQLRVEHVWPIDLGVAYYFDNNAALSEDELDLKANTYVLAPFPSGGSRIGMSAWRANAALCPYERGLESGTLQLCAGLFGELLRAKSYGLLEASNKSRTLFAFEGYARWHFPLGKVIGVTYSAGLFVPFSRDRFGYLDRFGDFTTKFRISAIGGRLDLALTYALE